ncbi:hypothetical protein K7X08_009260 [Anisodus acutangulus]|uniref:Uncharacterized protein n=1 Tax=Anisodus acutangulus TaxID=402998 RepID=A0A9Q1RTB7_9SOLA|nr:hypothetical protein K7X08_009260 [Anisodus acutangulus]
MVVEEAERCCVVLVPSPFQGHITPMLQLAFVLYAKGFSIVINHPELNPPDSSKHPEFTFLPLKDGMSNSDPSFLNLFDIIPERNMNGRVPFHDYLVEMMEKPEIYGRISCIVYDHLMYLTTEVADHLKLPTILLRVSSCAYMEAACTFFQLKADNYFPMPESQLLIQCQKYLPSAIIWNTIENLENQALSWFQQHDRVPIFTIGPLHKITSSLHMSLAEQDTSCISWIDTQAPNSVLYVSLGSIVVMDKEEFVETAWGLFNSNQLFLWVVRPSATEHDLPIEAVGDRGHIVKWAPQKEVLAHPAVGGFWSHCCWNSTLESILEGVPMICRPCFGDQNVNAILDSCMEGRP